MIDHFINKSIDGSYVVFGKRFDSQEKAVAYATETIARREQLAARKLSAMELVLGLSGNRQDTRSSVEKMTANEFQVVMPATKSGDSDANYWRDPEIRELMLGKRKQTRKGLLAEAEAEFDAKQKAKTDTKETSPKREQAVAWAEANWEQTAFNPNATAGDVQFAKQLLEQARKGCLTHFSGMADMTVAKQQEAFEAKRQALQLQQQEAAASLLTMRAPAHPLTSNTTFIGRTTKVNRFTDGSVDIVDVNSKEILKRYKPGEQLPDDVAAAVESL